MNEMTMPVPMSRSTAEREGAGLPPIVTAGARAAIAAPLVGIFSIVVGIPVFTKDLAEVAGTGRFQLATATALAVVVSLTLALVAAYRAQEARLGALGHAGFLAALTGTVLAAGGAWDSVFAVPFLAEQAPGALEAGTSGSLLAGYVVSYLALALGWLVFGSRRCGHASCREAPRSC